MATRAVYTFMGFPANGLRHLDLHHDGYPTGAAWRFAEALRDAHEPAAFLAAFLRTQPRADVSRAWSRPPMRNTDTRWSYARVLIRCRRSNAGGGSPAPAVGTLAAGRWRWWCSFNASCPVVFQAERPSVPQCLSMGSEKVLLFAAERPDQVRPCNPPAAQRILGCFVLAEQLTVGIKADPVAVEQFVHVRGEQQAVGTVEAPAVVAVPPGLDVARHQELPPRQARDPAGRFLLRHAMTK